LLLWPGDLFLATGLNAAVLVTLLERQLVGMYKNPKNASMVRKIAFQVKSYLFNLHEMFKNSGSEVGFINKIKSWMKRYLFEKSTFQTEFMNKQRKDIFSPVVKA
jgi:hypothetical protein